MNRQTIPDKEIRILLIDDDLDILTPNLELIRRNWSEDSRGARSAERVYQMIDEEEFVPTLVLHDCNPLEWEKDPEESETAGDDLYRYFMRKKIPVIVLSANPETRTLQREPYRSPPPIAWISKPFDLEKMAVAMEKFRASDEV